MIRVIYHLIIAGLRHILSLHFSGFINFEEHWMSINTVASCFHSAHNSTGTGELSVNTWVNSNCVTYLTKLLRDFLVN